MLKLSRKLEYALIALRHIQGNGDIICSTKAISEEYMIPRPLLAKILQKLAQLQYIDAIQGPHGGYRMHSALENISLTQFIEDIEGPLAMVECSVNMDCVQLNNCNIRIPINKINENIRSVFNSISITEITT